MRRCTAVDVMDVPGAAARVVSAALCSVGVAALLVGCTTTSTTTSEKTPQVQHASAAPSSAAPSTIPIPARLPGEIARTVVTVDRDRVDAGDVPDGTKRLYLHLRCTGPAGTTLHYSLYTGAGHRFGSAGDWPCDRTPGLIQDESVTSPISGAQVRARPDAGVTVAWAVLSTTAAG